MQAHKHHSRQFCFSIARGHDDALDDSESEKNRTVYLAADNEKDYRDWMKRISDAARGPVNAPPTAEEYYAILGLDKATVTVNSALLRYSLCSLTRRPRIQLRRRFASLHFATIQIGVATQPNFRKQLKRKIYALRNSNIVLSPSLSQLRSADCD